MKCRHCGKQIKPFNNHRGERDWTHEDQMTGRWCRMTAAEPLHRRCDCERGHPVDVCAECGDDWPCKEAK